MAPRAAEPQPGELVGPEVRASRSPSDTAVEFLILFARTGHEAGYPTADLEDRVMTLGRSLEVEGVQVSATPTLVELSLGSLPQQQTTVETQTTRDGDQRRPGHDNRGFDVDDHRRDARTDVVD